VGSIHMSLESRFRNLAPLLVIMAGACWGVIGVFTKQLASAGFSSMQIVFIRFAAAAVLLWLYLLFFDRDKLKIRFRDIWLFVGTGVISLVFFSTLYFMTIQLATLSAAAVLLYTAPCFVIIMSAIIFRERINSWKITALVLALTGCIFTTGTFEALIKGSGIGSVPMLGILTGIGSGFGYALYSIFGTAALKRYNTVTVTAYTFLTAALSLLPFCIGREFLDMLWGAGVIENAAGIALISTLIPYLLYTQGLKYTKPGNASVLAFSEPMVASLTGIIVFHEEITPYGAAGILLLFLSILILSTKGKKKTADI
jgi:DME family drug/metabolite transporter